jgi:dihydroneopterin aldolase
MGTLVVKNLRFRSRHGYHDFERVVGNTFEVDLKFKTDLSKAGESDKLEDTLDYSTACTIVEDVMNGEPVHLVETLLARIGEQLMDEFSEVEFLEVALRKFHPPMETTCEYIEIRDQWQR